MNVKPPSSKSYTPILPETPEISRQRSEQVMKQVSIITKSFYLHKANFFKNPNISHRTKLIMNHYTKIVRIERMSGMKGSASPLEACKIFEAAHILTNMKKSNATKL